MAAAALAAVAALVAGCSVGGDYPAVLDSPAPRSEQIMTPDQVKEATDALISERNRLSGTSTQQHMQAGTSASSGTAGNTGNGTKP